MQGFVVIDRQPESSWVAMWHVTRVGHTLIENTNAVVLDLEADVAAVRKMHSLTRQRIVMITDGSSLDGLPVSVPVLTSRDVDALGTSTLDHQQRILSAVDDYIRRTGKRSIVRPEFVVGEVRPVVEFASTPASRALSLANALGASWQRWLRTDEERRRRTANSRGSSPWIMPPELGSLALAELPVEFVARAQPQPVEAFSA